MSKRQQQHVTAMLYDKRGRLLSVGHNSYIKTHTVQARAAKAVGKPDSIYLHAEVAAIVKCANIEYAHKIVVLRFTKDGEPALARPCAICQRVIASTNIKVIEHS